MITLSNGHSFEYVVASGALGFDGQGWPWERPLVHTGLIKPELFTVVTKTLTHIPRPGNLRWWKPWECVRLLPNGGAVNKVGLTNPGIKWWCEEVGPKLNYGKFPIVGSIFGSEMELVVMTEMLNHFDLVGIEVNVSCPNTGHELARTMAVAESVKAVARVSHHPIFVKLSVDQDYLAITRQLSGVAQAVALNSVLWSIVFTNGERSPLSKLEKRVGGGGGGVSGKPAQKHNWVAVRALADQGSIPVIGPSIMDFEDIAHVRRLGARAVSFGAIHLRTPWNPTKFVEWECR